MRCNIKKFTDFTPKIAVDAAPRLPVKSVVFCAVAQSHLDYASTVLFRDFR